MKTTKIVLFLLIIILFFSCNKNKDNVIEPPIVNESNSEPVYKNNSVQIDKEIQITEQEEVFETNNKRVRYLVGETFDYLTDYFWMVSDGRYLLDPPVQTINWVGKMTPCIIFYELNIPPISIMYQERLRNEMFTLRYQTEEEENKLFPVYNSFSDKIYDVKFGNDFNTLAFLVGNTLYWRKDRTNQQEDFEHPLVGIWGGMPVSLHEYRIVDTTDCLYYMEIDKEIPYWGVRRGTYLLKKIDNKTFETVSSFPDGKLRLVVESRNQMLMTPLFTLPEDEEGILGPLVLHRNSRKISVLLNDPDYLEYKSR
ncbi:MAG: hypothetical protein FWB86_00695 [Treponema sp.]|nr:hypothetical protein [Treponema sp.]MCL2250613.1 hypothetical protein [Treponema sp.]